jgi:PAS domain-containing protein
MAIKLLDTARVARSKEAVVFITNILQASTECSIIGKGLDGTILLWNEGAPCLYGYDPDEVINKANSSILHPEDVEAGRHREYLDAALASRGGKFARTHRPPAPRPGHPPPAPAMEMARVPSMEVRVCPPRNSIRSLSTTKLARRLSLPRSDAKRLC